MRGDRNGRKTGKILEEDAEDGCADLVSVCRDRDGCSGAGNLLSVMRLEN